MTSAPYKASRNRRMDSNTPMLAGEAAHALSERRPPGDHDAVPLEALDVDGNPVHLAQLLFGENLVDGPDAEAGLRHQPDALDVIGDLVQCMAYHDHRQPMPLVQVADQAKYLRG